MNDNFTLKLLKYWRNSLADSEKGDVKPEKLEASGEAFKIPKNEISEGRINTDLARKLIGTHNAIQAEENKYNRKRYYEDQDLQGIKVLVCPIFAESIPPHGKIDSTTENPIKPILIPARLYSDGRLDPVHDDLP
jgi:hypothetical protein